MTRQTERRGASGAFRVAVGVVQCALVLAGCAKKDGAGADVAPVEPQVVQQAPVAETAMADAVQTVAQDSEPEPQMPEVYSFRDFCDDRKAFFYPLAGGRRLCSKSNSWCGRYCYYIVDDSEEKIYPLSELSLPEVGRWCVTSGIELELDTNGYGTRSVPERSVYPFIPDRNSDAVWCALMGECGWIALGKIAADGTVEQVIRSDIGAAFDYARLGYADDVNFRIQLGAIDLGEPSFLIDIQNETVRYMPDGEMPEESDAADDGEPADVAAPTGADGAGDAKEAQPVKERPKKQRDPSFLHAKREGDLERLTDFDVERQFFGREEYFLGLCEKGRNRYPEWFDDFYIGYVDYNYPLADGKNLCLMSLKDYYRTELYCIADEETRTICPVPGLSVPEAGFYCRASGIDPDLRPTWYSDGDDSGYPFLPDKDSDAVWCALTSSSGWFAMAKIAADGTVEQVLVDRFADSLLILPDSRLCYTEGNAVGIAIAQDEGELLFAANGAGAELPEGGQL